MWQTHPCPRSFPLPVGAEPHSLPLCIQLQCIQYGALSSAVTLPQCSMVYTSVFSWPNLIRAKNRNRKKKKEQTNSVITLYKLVGKDGPSWFQPRPGQLESGAASHCTSGWQSLSWPRYTQVYMRWGGVMDKKGECSSWGSRGNVPPSRHLLLSPSVTPWFSVKGVHGAGISSGMSPWCPSLSVETILIKRQVLALGY